MYLNIPASHVFCQKNYKSKTFLKNEIPPSLMRGRQKADICPNDYQALR